MKRVLHILGETGDDKTEADTQSASSSRTCGLTSTRKAIRYIPIPISYKRSLGSRQLQGRNGAEGTQRYKFMGGFTQRDRPHATTNEEVLERV